MTTMPVEQGFYITSPFGWRDGFIHYGTDFGRDGGSGGHPVYAIRSGTVVHAGPASGFGQWVTVDHPAEVGGGFSVYGHTIPEVTPGQHVEEGQRIARINPDPNTNGGFPPHLHLEFHRYVWSPPGPDRLDPEPILAGAGWPNQQRKEEKPMSETIFGVDVSEWQDGISLRRAADEGIRFAIIRTTDGTYRDRCYQSHMRDAEAAGLVTAAYHFLRNPSEGTSVRAQVDASLDVMGDLRRPVWIDCETEAGLSINDIWECKRLYEANGVRVIGMYSYIPWWEGRVFEGEPDLKDSGLGALWMAHYGQNPGGPPAAIYPGDAHPKWDYPLGNVKPAIWQFGSQGHVAGFTEVDVNAFRGSVEELRALFYGGNPETDELEEILSTVRPSLISPDKQFDGFDFLRFSDAAAWEIRVLLIYLMHALKLDPEKVLAEAKATINK